MEIADVSVEKIQHVGYQTPRYADPNIQFNDADTHLAAEYIPCQENSDAILSITNQGDATDIAMIALQIMGHMDNPGVIPVNGSPTFHMDAGETMNLRLNMHFNEDYWKETEDLTIRFYAGWKVSDTQMNVTDTITLYTTVVVNGGNGNGNGNGDKRCEEYTNAQDCYDAGCYWYAKHFWEAPSCHTNPQNMLMDNLPIILLGVGGAVMVGAVYYITRKEDKYRQRYPGYYPPEREYRPQPEERYRPPEYRQPTEQYRRY